MRRGVDRGERLLPHAHVVRAGQLGERDAQRRGVPERLGDGQRAEDEVLPRRDQLDVDAIARERPEGQDRLDGADPAPGDDDAQAPVSVEIARGWHERDDSTSRHGPGRRGFAADRAGRTTQSPHEPPGATWQTSRRGSGATAARRGRMGRDVLPVATGPRLVPRALVRGRALPRAGRARPTARAGPRGGSRPHGAEHPSLTWRARTHRRCSSPSCTRRWCRRRPSRGSGCSARLRDGRGRRLSLVACPAGFGKSTLLAAWREAESGERPMAWVTLDEGDNDVVVLWSHVLEALGRACPALAETEPRGDRPGGAAARGGAAEARERARRAGEDVVLVLDDFHRAVGRVGARERRLVRRPSPRVVPARAREPDGPGAAAGRAAGARGAAGAARRRAAVHRGGGGGVPQRAARPGAGPGRRRAARRADGGMARRALPGGALARRQAGQARAGPGLRRHERARRGLPRRRGARRLRAGAADVHAAHVGARAPVRRALRRGARAADVGRARWSRSRARTCSSCRSTAAAGGSGSITCSPRSCAWSWSGASRGSCRSSTAARTRGTARPARPTRRSTTRWRRACSARPRRLIAESWVHYANSGRTASVLDWLTRFPAELLDADRRLLLVKAWVVALRGRADGDAERRGPGARPRRARRRAAARRHGVASSRASRC